MTSFDWPALFSLIAHELRSPASVITGCARMLADGRLGEADRERVYGQIQRAGARVTMLCEQSSEFARWLRPDATGLPTSPVPVRTLLTRAAAASAASDRIALDGGPGSNAPSDLDTLSIAALSRDALTAAVTTLFDLAAREAPDESLGAVIHVDPDGRSCDILIGPSTALATLPADGGHAQFSQLSLEAGGMGLALVVCAAVVAAHEGGLLTFPNQRNVFGVRLHAERES